MGAALTYARRYGLFTLVGLAGEDDLDATELAPETMKNRSRPADTSNAAEGQQSRTSRPRGRPRKLAPPDRSSSAEDPAAELERVEDADRLLRWALDALPRRNRMNDEERAALDQAFRARAEALGLEPDSAGVSRLSPRACRARQQRPAILDGVAQYAPLKTASPVREALSAAPPQGGDHPAPGWSLRRLRHAPDHGVLRLRPPPSPRLAR